MNEDSQQALNPWVSILIRPRETIQQVVDNDPNSNILLLAVLLGIAQAINELAYPAFTDQLLFELLVEMIVSCAVGIISVYVSSFFTFMTGMWIGGDAPLSHVRAATAWSYLPFIAASFVIIPLTWIFRGSAHEVARVLKAAAAILTLIVGFKTLSQVQEFSMCKTAVNMFLSLLINMALLFVLMIPLSMIIAVLANL